MGLMVLATDEHHMIFGTANRKLADIDGLVINICHPCHMRLHQQGIYREEMKKLAEKTWLKHYKKTITDWIKRYGKNYLD